MEIDILIILAFVLSTAATLAITLFVKSWIQTKLEYRKLRRKLEKVAEKHTHIIYSVNLPGVGSQLFRIEDVDEHGITLENEMQRIFIPAKKLLKSLSSHIDIIAT